MIATLDVIGWAAVGAAVLGLVAVIVSEYRKHKRGQ